MAKVKSYAVYNQFPHFISPASTGYGPSEVRPKVQRPTEPPAIIADPDEPELESPCCLPLLPPDGADHEAVGVALLSTRDQDVARRYVFSALAVSLPSPDELGPYDRYEAVLFEPGLISFVATLSLTPSQAWAGSLTGISLPFTENMRVVVRPVNDQSGASGEPVLSGSAERCAAEVD